MRNQTSRTGLCKSTHRTSLNSLSAVLDTVHGRIRSFWKYTDTGVRYEIDTPVETEVIIGGIRKTVGKGKYIFGEAV